MVPRFPTVRPRHLLTGVPLAGLLVLALGVGRGAPVPHTAAQTAAPAAGHAQVIAQAVVDLPDDSLAWTLTTIEATERPTDLDRSGEPGFVLGTDGTVVVRDAAGARTRLAGGEALAVRPGADLSVRAAGADPASVSLLTLGRAEPDALGDTIEAGAAFASPGGSRDVELVGDVLAEGETAHLAGSEAPILLLVTGGSVAFEQDADETQVMQAGDTALVPGDLVVTGAGEEPARFVAAVIGADVNATEEAESASPDSTPSGTQTPSRPKPTTPASSPKPRSSPTPTPDGNGPEADPESHP